MSERDEHLAGLLALLGEVESLEASVDAGALAGADAVATSSLPGAAPRGGVEPAPLVPVPRLGRRRWGSRHLHAALRAAALLLAALGLTWALDRSPPSAPRTAQAPLPPNTGLLQIAHLPDDGDGRASAGRVDQFWLSAPDDRAYVVLLRGWDGTCDCLHWRSPAANRSREGTLPPRGRLRAGEDGIVEVDVTDHPPVEQLLVVISAPSSELLPWSEDQICDLLSCLDLSSPSLESRPLPRSAFPRWAQPLPVDTAPRDVRLCLGGDLEVASLPFVVH